MPCPVGTPPGRIVYLDWNVMVDLRSGKFPNLKRELDDLRNARRICVPYSATHVDELQGIHRSSGSPDLDKIARLLNWLREFTAGRYLYSAVDVKTPEFRQVDPARVLATLNEVLWARSAMQDLATLLSASQVRDFRRAAGLDPNKINNLRRPRVLEQLEALFRASLENQPGTQLPPTSLRGMIRMASNCHREGTKFGWSHDVAGIMMLLNCLGLWADQNFTDKNWASSFADGEHVALAAYTDLFVTSDRRLRVKALAVYEYYEISTEVLVPEAAREWLERES